MTNVSSAEAAQGTSARTLTGTLLLTFVESLGTILLERGLYFFTHSRFGFSRSENLGVAFSFGVFYVVGALTSHRLAVWFGERRVLFINLLLLLSTHLVLTYQPTSITIVALFPLVALLQGMKWPLIETFVSAGRTPGAMFRLIGYFNVSWAISVPLGLAVSGPLIAANSPSWLFGLAAAINVIGLSLLTLLPSRPVHLAADHPERPKESVLSGFQRLLIASRWSMLASYSLLFLMAPLMPQVFTDLGLSVQASTLAASWLDVVRVLTFASLGFSTAWQGKRLLLLGVVLALPLGFGLSVFAPSLSVALLGETIFGVASALTYYSALLYALVVRNASVDAGGAHEGLIGLGFAIGPLLGLLAIWAEPLAGGALPAMCLVAGPFLFVCGLSSLRMLVRPGRASEAS